MKTIANPDPVLLLQAQIPKAMIPLIMKASFSYLTITEAIDKFHFQKLNCCRLREEWIT